MARSSAQRKATEHAKANFLAELAVSGNVTASAKVAGVDRVTAYRWADADEAFSEAWEDALAQATDRLELEARRRAHDGYEEPVFYQGVEVGKVRKYSDTLMIQLLKAHHPAHRDTRNLRIGGDPDAPPITSASVTVDPSTLPDDAREAALALAHKAMQRGAK